MDKESMEPTADSDQPRYQLRNRTTPNIGGGTR